MTLLVVGYVLISIAALIGNLAIETMRLLAPNGPPAWTGHLNWVFTATLAPIIVLVTLPLWAFGRRSVATRH